MHLCLAKLCQDISCSSILGAVNQHQHQQQQQKQSNKWQAIVMQYFPRWRSIEGLPKFSGNMYVNFMQYIDTHNSIIYFWDEKRDLAKQEFSLWLLLVDQFPTNANGYPMICLFCIVSSPWQKFCMEKFIFWGWMLPADWNLLSLHINSKKKNESNMIHFMQLWW